MSKRRRLTLTKAETATIHRFLWGTLIKQGPPPLNTYSVAGISREQHSASYQQWARGGHAWNAMEQGSTGQMAALCWYHHIHKPGSREWRPSVIIRALLAAAAQQARAGEVGG
jgi:hypothetical protein